MIVQVSSLHDIPHEEDRTGPLAELMLMDVVCVLLSFLAFLFSILFFSLTYILGSCPISSTSGIAKVMGLCILCSPDDIWD